MLEGPGKWGERDWYAGYWVGSEHSKCGFILMEKLSFHRNLTDRPYIGEHIGFMSLVFLPDNKSPSVVMVVLTSAGLIHNTIEYRRSENIF